MKDFAKARWTSDGDDISLGMEFSKVDKARRMVAGWATIDNVDTENDVVTADASIDAFKRSRGNLREMHKKDSAVGRIVNYKEKKFTDPDGNEHRGIFVKVYVSEGAEDTWKKVLDGTLNGFSIGGKIIDFEEDFSKSGHSIRKVTKYDLNELSLVDNPGNQYSDFTNIFKLKKSADGSVTSVTGLIEEQKILNVFYCPSEEISIQSPGDSYDCPVCETSMISIGFVEDNSGRNEKVSTLVTKFKNSEGGAQMEKNKDEVTDETVETGHPEGEPTEVPTPARTEDEEVPENVEEVSSETDEEPESVEEVHDESEEIAKVIDSLKTDIADILSESNRSNAEKMAKLEKTIGETRELMEQKFTELEKRHDSLNKDLEATKSKTTKLTDALNKINNNVALKKSVDLDDSTGEKQKNESNWGGAFSVDNLFG